MWYQEMFNPHCRETKGCFNPTVSGEGGGGVRGGMWEVGGRVLWVCWGGFCEGISSSLFTVSQSQQTRRGIHSHWDYDIWIMLSRGGGAHWRDLLTHAEIKGDAFSLFLMVVLTPCCHQFCTKCSVWCFKSAGDFSSPASLMILLLDNGLDDFLFFYDHVSWKKFYIFNCVSRLNMRNSCSYFFYSIVQ